MDAPQHLNAFLTETKRAIDLLATILPETVPLNDSETLTFRHSKISNENYDVSVPDIPAYLDAVLPDTHFGGGLEPMLGEKHLRLVSVLGFPNATTSGIFDELNDLGFEYRWTTRFIPLDKAEATRLLNS